MSSDDKYTPDMTCCFTGHRDIPRSRYIETGERVKTEILRLYDIGVRRFIAGGALGFDMICSVVTHNLKLYKKDIFLTIALPCKNHDTGWSARDRAQLAALISRADEVIYVSESYGRECMFRRNRYMVDRSGYCISYCRKNGGGSFYTVSYAKKRGLIITDISGE